MKEIVGRVHFLTDQSGDVTPSEREAIGDATGQRGARQNRDRIVLMRGCAVQATCHATGVVGIQGERTQRWHRKFRAVRKRRVPEVVAQRGDAHRLTQFRAPGRRSERITPKARVKRPSCQLHRSDGMSVARVDRTRKRQFGESHLPDAAEPLNERVVHNRQFRRINHDGTVQGVAYFHRTVITPAPMTPIAPIDALRVGDVIHHAAFGFATVAGVDERGASLRWEKQSANHPQHASRHALSTSYRRCRPGGLLSRSVEEGETIRRLSREEPVAVLGLLLLDLGGAQRCDDVREWMQRLFGEPGFEIWWEALLTLSGADPRFVVSRETIDLAGDVDAGSFLGDDPEVLPSDIDGAVPEDASDEPSSPPLPGRLGGEEAWDAAEALAAELAVRHAAGVSVIRTAEAVREADGQWRLETDVAFDPAADVRFVARMALEQALGPLPREDQLADSELVDVAAAGSGDLAPELLGVLQLALAADIDLRPRDGIALLQELVVARAVSSVRGAAPSVPRAGLCAGFDTHIGLVKSLIGQTNQDAFLLLGDPECALFCVADGISTSTAGSGDLASGLLVRTLRLQWATHGADLRRGGSPAQFLEAALDRANSVVCEAAARLAGGDLTRHIPMGSTAIIGISIGNRVHLAALGDSKAWLVGRHGVAPLAYDQNLNSLRFRETLVGGEVGWEDNGHALTGYVGHFDLSGRPSLPQVFHRTFTILPGEWLILASDGLSDYAAPEAAAVSRLLQRVLAEAPDRADAPAAMEVAAKLVLAANKGGGGDNVTVLALTLSPERPTTPGETSIPS